ncbi:haloacid dehalogenase-like hydrolase [Bradyrhizobium viridifuturi]|jgi:phosphoserine phosphatase|nr:MAG: multiple sugar transport system permease [Bradyrhizobium sp. DFCI-1]MBK5650141.1 haloacid dehalogenase-like hydrolase [Rhizobium sp.]MBR1025291.1 haloacid dehalogenase-like hydrolase [Bradyrhizobium viridifuturi]MCA3793017.1 haloacid dehalogenase-like hydrolase [Burkholderia sp.]OYU57715.1 MAG: haloacid dehalogenase-like hydrolase [Bradyrhizobium sp. PARBB1]PSO14188.1 haloacid dehalogenase-like hydrolase [Bradyrhizobium sp. MOS004]QRI70064.1 haloacid dehalogenase-like hydrolase [Brady
MPKKLIPMAIAYDFDGTLAQGNVQENTFIPAIGMTKAKFWSRNKERAEKHEADEILSYMTFMLERAKAAGVPVRRRDIAQHGKTVKLFPGVEKWFARINAHAGRHNVKLEHFIISSGIKEMIRASKIGRQFRKIFASSFAYDENGVASWPALAINYTTKTQYLFRINKGALTVSDHKKINEYVDPDQRPIPFSNIVFIGDGDTDIPCMRLVREQGGHSIAVYRPNTSSKKAQKLITDRRADFISPADYSDGKSLDLIMKTIIEKIAASDAVRQMKRNS